ncbi:RNA-binding protein 7-like [Actinia tenebrosa]|uniref:RNA-binding protein 7-like n=1 Tax=Actinia tenebrosa TaxID=6105 RepID=A0A6P8HV44_ACTTE|nr:RNA-binding protein 7-like [Actinia tenebrosa]
MSKGDYSSRECSVYVGNLEKRVTEEIMWELFLQAGPVDRVSIPKDKDTGIQRSFGFVEFSSPVSVTYASELINGLCLYGQSIVVKPQNIGSPAPNQANRSSPLSFNSDLSRHSPVPLFQGKPNDAMTPYMGNSQRHGQNSYGSNNYQHGGYSSPQYGNPLPNSLMQQQYQARIHYEKKRRY